MIRGATDHHSGGQPRASSLVARIAVLVGRLIACRCFLKLFSGAGPNRGRRATLFQRTPHTSRTERSSSQYPLRIRRIIPSVDHSTMMAVSTTFQRFVSREPRGPAPAASRPSPPRPLRRSPPTRARRSPPAPRAAPPPPPPGCASPPARASTTSGSSRPGPLPTSPALTWATCRSISPGRRRRLLC